MNASVNKTNQIRLDKIHRELFDMANSYAGNEYGHIACRLHSISNSVYNIRDIMKVLCLSDPYGISTEDRYGRDVVSEKVKLHPDKAERQDCADCLYPERSCSQCINKAKESKLLAQYLDEYVNHEYTTGQLIGSDRSWRELLEQALDAYEITEQVEIKIEKI